MLDLSLPQFSGRDVSRQVFPSAAALVADIVDENAWPRYEVQVRPAGRVHWAALQSEDAAAPPFDVACLASGVARVRSA